MLLSINKNPLTCVDLSKLLGIEVRQIADGVEGLEISLTAKEADITADHVAVLTEIYGGQTVELITEDTKNEIIIR